MSLPPTTDARTSAVATLVNLAGSPDYRDRGDAGIALSRFVEDRQARVCLRALVLDADNVWVTQVVSEALVRSGDESGLAILADALDEADDQQVEWIGTGVAHAVRMHDEARAEGVRACERLAKDARTEVARNAAALRALFAGAGPVG